MAFFFSLLFVSLSSALIDAAVITESVSYSDGNVKLSGFLAYPAGFPANTKFPVVLHVPAWTGLTDFERGRANRTAEELGYIGFAVSVFDMNETAKAGTGMQARIPIVGKYNRAPQLIVSRLAAAVAFVKQHAKADAKHAIAAAGYCFGGSAVLQFARLGGAKKAGVTGVASFHGGLAGIAAPNASWNNTKVLILNGFDDGQIPKKDIDAVQASLISAGNTWEFTNYGSNVGHGFTHPADGSAHFHYNKNAEERSWTSMTDFLRNSLGFKGPAKAPVVALKTEQVTYMDGGVKLTGYIAYRADAKGPLPVVLHVHGWGGLSDFEKGRANRTAAELGYIGFAVSVYDNNETAKAATGMQARMATSGKYNRAPQLIVSRLAAAVAFAKKHAKADANKISAAGYCFGGAAVLQFARLGGAATSGVGSVISFHGTLNLIAGLQGNFCPTRVAVYNGAKDPLIKDAELVALQQALESTKTYWELTNYSGAEHGFTHPVASDAHYHFEKTAESRSWMSMAHFLKDSFAGKGVANSSVCAAFTPKSKKPDTGTVGSATCMDDNAAVEKAGGAWGIKKCSSDLCKGQYKDMMLPMCKKTCGLCKVSMACADDDAAVEKAGGAWGVKKCSSDLCKGQYKDMMQPLCKKTCGLCEVRTMTTTATTNTAATTTLATTTTTATTATTATMAPTTASAAMTLHGSMEMTVPDAAAFKADTAARKAVAEGIAGVVGVPSSYITLIVTVGGSRRLASNSSAGKVKVAYTILVPAGSTVSTAAVKQNMESATLSAFTTAVQTKITAVKGASYKVTVNSKTPVTSSAMVVQASSVGSVQASISIFFAVLLAATY